MSTFLSILPYLFILIAVINLVLAIIQIRTGAVLEGLISIGFMAFNLVLSFVLKDKNVPVYCTVIINLIFCVFAFVGFSKQIYGFSGKGIAWGGGILNLFVFICTFISLFAAIIGAILSLLAIITGSIFSAKYKDS